MIRVDPIELDRALQRWNQVYGQQDSTLVPPPVDFVHVERDLKDVVFSQRLGGEVQCFMSRKGYEGKNVEPLVDSIRARKDTGSQTSTHRYSGD